MGGWVLRWVGGWVGGEPPWCMDYVTVSVFVLHVYAARVSYT